MLRIPSAIRPVTQLLSKVCVMVRHCLGLLDGDMLNLSFDFNALNMPDKAIAYAQNKHARNPDIPTRHQQAKILVRYLLWNLPARRRPRPSHRPPRMNNAAARNDTRLLSALAITRRAENDLAVLFSRASFGGPSCWRRYLV